MDKTDTEILDLLLKNARTSYQELGDALGMTRVAAKKRVMKLEKEGIIRGYSISVSPETMDLVEQYRSDGIAPDEKKVEVSGMDEWRSMLDRKIEDKAFVKWVCDRQGVFRFPVYENMQAMENDIGALELSVRAYNCLRRAGYGSIRQLTSNIEGRESLQRIRNMGKKSTGEVMLKLFLYTYENLSPEKKRSYLKRVMELNR